MGQLKYKIEYQPEWIYPDNSALKAKYKAIPRKILEDHGENEQTPIVIRQVRRRSNFSRSTALIFTCYIAFTRSIGMLNLVQNR
jgi:hypothetical protein